MVKNKKTFPSLKDLELVRGRIKEIPNQKGEYLRGVHYGCFLLCSQAGLRVSEAVKFDLSAKSKQSLYRISKPKGKKERFVYVSKEVINELKKNNWQPNQTNRWNFYHFLKKTKRELNISKKIELTPHTLRRSFTTYHAENGLPLPLLQKLLGHSSIRTTALYWQNVNNHGDDDDKDISDILAGKKWLERHKPSQNKKPPTSPTTENFPNQLPNKIEPVIIPEIQSIPRGQKPVINSDNSQPSIKVEENPTIDNYQSEPSKEIPPKDQEKFSLKLAESNKPTIISEPLPVINEKEQILLGKVKQLEEQLKEVQGENDRLRIEKEQAETLAQQEKERAGQLEMKLKTVARVLYQIKKIDYYKKLEKEQKAQIEQPPPWKGKK